MGTNYSYVNRTKREFFELDALGGGSTLSCISNTPASRIFELLLTRCQQNRPPGSLLGRWAGDMISIVGDDGLEFDEILDTFADIGPNVILFAYQIEGFDWLWEWMEFDESLFKQVCHLCVTGQADELEKGLVEKLGRSYGQEYRKLCAESGPWRPKNLAVLESR